MDFSLREITSAFIVMFAVIDITGSTPIILDLKARGKKIEPLSAALGSFVLFMAFMFGGQWMLNLFRS
jgi:multiple antibiotic resistance protein